MESFVKIKNVGRGEGIFRSVTGVILLILAFFIPGGFRWVLGIIGVALILTTIFGY
jgi:predicted phage tail protein